MPSTLLQLRQATARALDDWGGYGVTGASGVGFVVLGALRDVTPQASSNRFDGAWLYFPNDGSVRRVIKGGYTPNSGRLDIELEGGIPPINTFVEMTRLFPAREAVAPEDVSYQTLIQRALSCMLVPDQVTLAISTADRFVTGAWKWLDRPERLVRVLEPAQTVGRAPVSAMWRNPRLVPDGPTPYLQIDVPYSAPVGDLTLEVLRPADTLVSGAESTTGPTSDAQTVIPSVADVLPFALWEAYRALAARGPGRVYPETSEALARYDGERRASRYWDQTAALPQAPAAAAEAEAA